MFADAREAADFSKNVNKRIGKIGRGTESTVTGDDTASMRSFNSAGSRRSSFMKSIFGSSSNASADGGVGKKTKGKVVREEDIGDPVGFQHLSHIGFNPNTGTFELNNIPPQWRKILQASGATEADLQNKETATFIAGFLDSVSKGKESAPPAPARNNGAASARSNVKKVPPPPPPKKSAPPPPPPKTNKSPQMAPRAARQSESAAAAPPRSIPMPPPFKDYLAFIEERKQVAVEKQHARDEEEAASPRPPRPTAPPGPSLNDQLLAGIRQASKTTLRHVEQPDPSSLPPMSPGLSDAPADAISGLLAQALKSRKQAVAMSDSDDDGEWS